MPTDVGAVAVDLAADRVADHVADHAACLAAGHQVGVPRVEEAFDTRHPDPRVATADPAAVEEHVPRIRQPDRVVEALLSLERTPEREKALRRFQGFMARRGIPGGIALQVLQDLRAEG